MSQERSANPKRIRSTNRYLTIDGETLLLCEWAEKYGNAPNLILGRLKSNWTESDAVKKPSRTYRLHRASPNTL